MVRYGMVLLALLYCGESSAQKNVKIIGGSVAATNAWPATVQIAKKDTSTSEAGFVCGGTLIASRWVLTAAHCVTSNVNGSAVLDGSADLYETRVSSAGVLGAGELRLVTNIMVHPDYDVSTVDSDLALLELANEVTAGELMPFYEGEPPVASLNAVAVGWGVTSNENSAPSTSLKEVTLSIVSNAECNRVMPDVTENMFCAGGPPEGGLDTCVGDSGGPLMVSQNGEYRQVGLTSWGGDSCAQAGEYGVYTRLSKFETWIAQYAGTKVVEKDADEGGGFLGGFTLLTLAMLRKFFRVAKEQG